MNNEGADYILTGTDACDIKEFMKLTVDNFVTAAWEINELHKELAELKAVPEKYKRGSITIPEEIKKTKKKIKKIIEEE